MVKKFKSIDSLVALLILILCVGYSSIGFAASAIEEGKKIAFDRKKGNCLACHAIKGGTMPGTLGPPLVGMKDRYPNKKKLRAQIWDATVRNPDSPMPPFGRHQIITEKELDKVVEFIYSL